MKNFTSHLLENMAASRRITITVHDEWNGARIGVVKIIICYAITILKQRN